jgi:hypothetical protein
MSDDMAFTYAQLGGVAGSPTCNATVSPTGVYAATADFGAQHSSVGLAERISKAAADFARLLRSCGPRTRRDVFAEKLTEMQHLLGASGSHDQDSGPLRANPRPGTWILRHRKAAGSDTIISMRVLTTGADRDKVAMLTATVFPASDGS